MTARLITLGDSLTQGFQSLAITYPERGYPSILARALEGAPAAFPVPNFEAYGGLPWNMEWLARELQIHYGDHISGFTWAEAVVKSRSLLHEVEHYWAQGEGSLPTTPELFYNLAIWGSEVLDAHRLTARFAYDVLHAHSDHRTLMSPRGARFRTAIRVLNPAHQETRWDSSQVTIAKEIAQTQGGIENLVIWFGGNNYLGTALRLKVIETGANTPDLRGMTPDPDRPNLWTPSMFQRDYVELAAQIQSLDAEHVFVCTLPYITIPPVLRGVNLDATHHTCDEGLHDYYVRFMVQDSTFLNDLCNHPHRHDYLTRTQVQHINGYIDSYNTTIREIASTLGWYVVETGDMLTRLASHRKNTPHEFLPCEFLDLNTQFFEITQEGQIKSGGLFALDGVHPTTCGYALIAKLIYEKMMEVHPHLSPVDEVFDFEMIRRSDTLVSTPPRTLHDIFDMMESLERHFGWVEFLEAVM